MRSKQEQRVWLRQVLPYLREQSTVTVKDIINEGGRCDVHQRLMEAIKSGSNDNDDELKPYMAPEIKHELTVINRCGVSGFLHCFPY